MTPRIKDLVNDPNKAQELSEIADKVRMGCLYARYMLPLYVLDEFHYPTNKV